MPARTYDPDAAHCAYELKQLQPLLGGTITGLIETKAHPAELVPAGFGFTVDTPAGCRYDVWVDQDPEGNGPGHLSISKR